VTARAAIAAAVLLSGTRTMAEPCAPAARLDGDDDVAARVAVELERLGVASTAAPGCPSLRAAVSRDPSGAVAVTIRDRADRIEGRVVGDEILAAIWIDSWLRDDVAAPVWAPRIVPLAPPSEAPVREIASVAAIAAAPAPDDRVAVDASYETAWTSDGAGWSGFSASACARIGFACAGARVRAAWLPKLVSDDGLAAASRSDLAALAIATASIEVGRMRIAPELGVGVGRMTTTRLDGCKSPQPPCDPNDPSAPMCTMPPVGCDPALSFVGDGFRAETWTPRAQASVRIAVPLFDHVWLEGTAAAQLAPGGHGAFDSAPDAAGNVAATIPAEPIASLALGVGLRVGAP
jgi:hypothetical protein